MKTILIVEDTELNIDLLTQLLEEDYNLLFAKDGAQGVSKPGATGKPRPDPDGYFTSHH
jgi:CheY-like chemotaxis protein